MRAGTCLSWSLLFCQHNGYLMNEWMDEGSFEGWGWGTVVGEGKREGRHWKRHVITSFKYPEWTSGRAGKGVEKLCSFPLSLSIFLSLLALEKVNCYIMRIHHIALWRGPCDKKWKSPVNRHWKRDEPYQEPYKWAILKADLLAPVKSSSDF